MIQSPSPIAVVVDDLDELIEPPSRLHEVFGIDLRALAVFRMALAVLLLCDLSVRLTDLRAHYTDWGLLPRAALVQQFQDPWEWSIHLMSGSAVVQGALMVGQIVLALLMFVGWRSRIVAFWSWVLLVSLHVRNPMVLHGGDILYRMLLFWSFFLPIGARWSIDALLNTRPLRETRAVSVASAGLLIQVALMYLFSVIHKSGDVWWTGKAVEMALQIDAFATPLAGWLLQYTLIMAALTWGTLVIEGAGPILAFVPFGTTPVRILVVLSFFALHLGMGLMLELGPFPWTCAAAWVPFLPSGVWDWIERRMDLRRWRADALRDWLRAYLPRRPIDIQPSALNTIAAMAVLVYVFLWNVRTTNFERWEPSLPRSLNAIGFLFRLDQAWTMFSPQPLTEDGWYVIPAQLGDGREIDLWTGQAVDWNKPPLPSAQYRNTRERKYMMNIWLREHADHRLHFARYLCRQWNERHADEPRRQVHTFQIYYMLEPTQKDRSVVPAKPQLLWSHDCFG